MPNRVLPGHLCGASAPEMRRIGTWLNMTCRHSHEGAGIDTVASQTNIYNREPA